MATFRGVKHRDGTITPPAQPVDEHAQVDELPAAPLESAPLRQFLDSITPPPAAPRVDEHAGEDLQNVGPGLLPSPRPAG